MTDGCHVCNRPFPSRRILVPVLTRGGFGQVAVCSMECAARFKKEEYARNHAAFRAYLRATTPQTFIRDQHGRYVPVDVPTADPPEWYARYLEECDQNPLPTDQRTGLRKSEDEWTMQKCWHATEDQWQTSRRPRHAIWG